MIGLIIQKLGDGAFLASLLAAVAAAAAVLTVGLPLLDRGDLNKRMKAVALERDSIRARERDRLSKGDKGGGLRTAPKAYMKSIVDRFKLGDWLGTETAKMRLMQAGYRGPQAEVAFLFFRLVTPIVLFLVTLIYVFGVLDLQQPAVIRLGMALAGAYIGIKLPEVFLSNKIAKRQESIRKAFPDALDLLLICVESGMSIEHAFRKVGSEVGRGSAALAEEMTLATAELSYLSERRQAYQNLADRTGLEGVKSICTALIQAERYGTPVGAALRVLAQENRDARMNEAEKKAAALPPKLTVPMILFFLPVLFAVILTPAMIQIFHWE